MHIKNIIQIYMTTKYWNMIEHFVYFKLKIIILKFEYAFWLFFAYFAFESFLNFQGISSDKNRNSNKFNFAGNEFSEDK